MSQNKKQKIYEQSLLNDDSFFNNEMDELFNYSIDNFLPEAAIELKQAEDDLVFTEARLFDQGPESTDPVYLFSQITWGSKAVVPYGETINSSLGDSGYVSSFKLPCPTKDNMLEIKCERRFDTVKEVLAFVCKKYRENNKTFGRNSFNGFSISKKRVWKMKIKPIQ
jgi:hypothetical protein